MIILYFRMLANRAGQGRAVSNQFVVTYDGRSACLGSVIDSRTMSVHFSIA